MFPSQQIPHSSIPLQTFKKTSISKWFLHNSSPPAPFRLRLPLERALGLDVGLVTQTCRTSGQIITTNHLPVGHLKWWWRVRDFFFSEIPETFRFRNYSHLPRMDGFLLEALLALFHRQFWRKSILKGVTSWWLKHFLVDCWFRGRLQSHSIHVWYLDLNHILA